MNNTNTTNTPDLRAALIEARDWFESQAKAVSKGCGYSYELHDLRVQRDALDAALAATPAQPVAWALQWPDDSRLNLSTVFDTQLEATDYLQSCSDGVVVVPLYAAPQQAAHLAAKWQLVPRQLTQDMAEAAKFVDGRLSVFKYADAWRAMLYAAPQPIAQAMIAATRKPLADD